MSVAHLETHLTGAERLLVKGLALRPVTLPASMAHATGLWKDAQVTITTRAYEGDAIEYMRVALVNGTQLSIGNLLAQGRPNRALPVLGADLVWLGAQRPAMIAVDLSSMREGAARDAEHRAIAALLPDISDLPSGGELPDWSKAWFSPRALYTRVGDEQLEAALAAFDGYVRTFIELAGEPPAPDVDADAVRARLRGYTMAHRTEDKGLGLLCTMFGKTWADEYVRGVLFPER